LVSREYVNTFQAAAEQVISDGISVLEATSNGDFQIKE
jgi:hypothetical protein